MAFFQTTLKQSDSRSKGWLLVMLLLISGCLSLNSCSHAPTLTVEMVGEGYHWYLRYPGADGVLHTDDDVMAERDLYLPAQTQVTIRVSSADYIYALKVPQLELNQMGVPDVVFDLVFASGEVATYDYLGDQMCGFSHDTLDGTFVVLSQTDFETWLEKQRKNPPQPRGTKKTSS